MAHELNVNEEGLVEMAYTGEIPWHGLGTKVNDDLTPAEFMAAANLDWEVQKVPLKPLERPLYLQSLDHR